MAASTRSTRWFNLFFPAKPPPERHRLDKAPAASLPPELLLEIFYHAARSNRAPDRDTVVYPTLDELERSSRHPLAGALLTCSYWAGPATVALYEQIGTSRLLSLTHTYAINPSINPSMPNAQCHPSMQLDPIP